MSWKKLADSFIYTKNPGRVEKYSMENIRHGESTYSGKMNTREEEL